MVALPALMVAQGKITVSGTVTDEDTKEALIGANILVAGDKSVGTATDIEGKFTIDVPSNATLTFSYIGYDTKSLPVQGATAMDVTLKVSAKSLDELVVVGYTTMKKRNVLGAVDKVGTSDLTVIPVSGADQALQGRVAGVTVSSATGAPGSTISVRVRGVSSLYSGNDPLYIIDGVQVDGGLNAIAPNDIDNIVVLKDAASTAIYGSRGANGIVLITTKKGKKGEAKVTYNTQIGFQSPSGMMKMVNAGDYVTLYNEATVTDNAISLVAQRPLIEGNYLQGLANINHLEELFRTAPVQSHDLSVSGGNDKTNYLVSASYFNQDGIIPNSGFNKALIRSNLNSEAKPWLSIGLNLSAGVSNTQLVPSSGDGYSNSEGGSAVRYALFRNPNIPTYDANGNYVDLPSAYFGGDKMYDTFFGDGYNALGQVNNVNRKKTEKTFIGSGNVLIKLPYKLMWKTVFGMNYVNGTFRDFEQNWGTNNRINNPNSVSLQNYEHYSWTLNSVLTRNFVINDLHTIDVMAGAESVYETYNSSTATDQNFVDDLVYLGKGLDEQKRTVSENANASSLASFFGSVSYNYNQKYFISATLREDGTSKFVKQNRWGAFYSVSAGWNIESEEFMKNFKSLDILKLRVSYGTVGNQNIPPYAYSNIISSGYNYPFGETKNQGYAMTTLGNENLKWETNRQLNVGLDVAFLKNSIGGSIDLYRRISSDMLAQSSIPLSMGYVTAPWINSGEMLNKGIDLEVFYRKNYRDAGFDIRLNGGVLKNEVLKMNAPIFAGRVDTGINATYTAPGHPIGSFYLLQMDGIFQNSMEVMTSAYQGMGISPGDVKYKDQDNNNIIDQNDRTFLGSAIPTFSLGSNLSGYWKSLDLSCFFQGDFGQKAYMQVFQDIEGFYRGFDVTQNYFDNRWTGEGTSNTQPRASWKMKSNNDKVSSRFLADASYLRLKNIQLGYTLPSLSKYGIEKVRIYIAATNVLTFTKYPGMDPEMTTSANASAAGEGDMARGIDWGTYPNPKTYSFGLNLTF